MRKFSFVVFVVLISGCQRNVQVPTAQELIANRALLSEWQGKCNNGEYSHLPADQKSALCSTTQEATVSVGEAAAAKKSDDFFNANIRRK